MVPYRMQILLNPANKQAYSTLLVFVDYEIHSRPTYLNSDSYILIKFPTLINQYSRRQLLNINEIICRFDNDFHNVAVL